MGNWGVVASDTIGIDTLPPLGSVHSITEASAYAYADGDTAYYSNVGGGQFTVRVAAEDTGSGLDRAEYPETTSSGAVYHTALGGEYQYQHTYTVTLQDALGRQSSVGFSVIRDTTPPTLTLAALVQGSDVHVTWSSDDGSSGVGASTCLLEVREDEGAWQTFSTECGGAVSFYILGIVAYNKCGRCQERLVMEIRVLVWVLSMFRESYVRRQCSCWVKLTRSASLPRCNSSPSFSASRR